MKVLVKLVIVALVANATWRVGSVYLRYYRFTDAVQETMQYRGGRTDEQVHDRIFELAAQYDVPVTDDNLKVTHNGAHTIVDGSYKQPIDLLPGFTYQWPFAVHIDTFVYDSSAEGSAPR